MPLGVDSVGDDDGAVVGVDSNGDDEGTLLDVH